MRWELPRLPFGELLSCCVLFKKEDVKRAPFNPDQFLQRRTIFSSENIGPADQNFQDQYSRDRPLSWSSGDREKYIAMPLKFQLYNAQHTHKLWCDVNNTGQYMCRLLYGTQDFLQRPHYCALMSWTIKCSVFLLVLCQAHCPTNQYTLMRLLLPLVSFPGQ